MPDQQSRATLETRLVHDLHRTVTTLLAEAAARPAASAPARVELREQAQATMAQLGGSS